ncbi:beta strand repeat-containing protein [Rhodanobacter sp. Col0626]|uniref:beta strand repeat-containing protein n=1 Tax=Rhodanobacter sp. Col0626 TaxID=3415679 RepID=UPI003CEC0D5F
MNRAVINTPNHFRNKALVGAIVAALSLGAASTAAAETTYGLASGTQTLTLQSYLQMVASQQVSAAPVSAADVDSEVGYRGPASGGSLTVSGNTFQALTLDTTTNLLGANGADNAIDLGLLGIQNDSLPVGDANQGIGILSGQFATAGVSTQVDHDNIGLDVTDYTAGDAAVTGNTLNSTTLVNGASNRATGALNTTPFSSALAGQVSVDYTPAGADVAAAGGVTIGNAQVAGGVTSSARITDSNISLVDAGVSGSAPVDVSGNAVTAADTGNRGDNRFSATAGAVSYAGAVGVVNGQVNIGGDTTAAILDTDIGAELDSPVYAGELSVTGNTMSASAQGNDAAAVDASGVLVRGNTISFGQGINVTGVNDSASLDLSIGAAGVTDGVHGTAAADLALLNTQGNQGGTIGGSIVDSRIGAEVGGLTGGSLTATQDHMAASAGGNSAINLVSANGASFDASVAVGNQQANDRTAIQASAIGLMVGTLGTGDVTGDVTVGSSSIAASANGNSAQTVVDLQASNLDAAGTLRAGALSTSTSLGLDHSNANYGDPGVMVGNLQGNYGADTTIGAQVADSLLGAMYAGDVLNNDTSVDYGTIAATASGNSASTSLAAAGTTGALKAVLGSGQYNANAITAIASGNFLGTGSEGGGFAGSNLTVGGGSLNASASANQATNSLTTAFDSSLTLASSVNANGSVMDANGGSNNAQAALNLLNNQTNDGADVTAVTADGEIGVVGLDAFGDSVTVQGNSAGASAIGNSAGNTLAPAAGNLVHGGNGDLAALGNLQLMSGDSTATVSGVGMGYAFAGEAGSLTGTVSGNTMNAFAGGNMAGGDGTAGNSLTASGTSLVDSGAAYVDASYNAGTSALAALASFTLQNAQTSTSGERSATIDGGSIGGSAVIVATDSNQSVTGNSMSADARDNYAVNSLGLDFDGSLTTTGMLQSAQTSTGGMTGVVSDSAIGLTAAQIDAGSLTVTNNGVSAKAVANTASNQFSVQASGLSGNAGDGYLSTLGVLADAAGYRGAVALGGTSMIVADYGLSNVQTRSGDSIAPSATGIQIGVSADTGDITGSPTTVSDNAVTVLGQGNSAGNGLALSGSSIDASAAILNSQSTSSAVNASASNIHVDISADDGLFGGMPLTVSGNSVDVSTGLNNATNALSVDAANTVNGQVGLAGASTDNESFDGFAGAVADFAVTNLQVGTSAATASLIDARVGILAGDDIAGTEGSLTVTGNQLDAQASGNNAGNSVALNGAGSVGATAAVHSQQTNGGAIATTVSGVDVSAGNRDTGNGDIVSQAVTLADNRVSGSASGNSASNAISVGSAALNAGFVGTEGNSSDVSTAIADYALNNVQGNTAAISSTMSNVTIGSNLSGGAGAVLNSHAAIGSNMVMASASGNSAGNSIMLASVAGMPSAALTSSQVNTASVTASISGAHIGMIASGLSNSPVTVSGNSITANAVGNSAINHIGIGM